MKWHILGVVARLAAPLIAVVLLLLGVTALPVARCLAVVEELGRLYGW